MIVVVFLSVGLGWFVGQAERQRKAVEAIRKAGGSVLYDYECDGLNKVMARAEPPSPAWLREPFADVASVVACGTQITDVELEYVKQMKNVEWLDLSGSRVTDAGLKNTKGLRKLRGLMLDDTQVTDVGLEYIRGLTRLEYLYFNNLQVTDMGLRYVKGLTSLKHLGLSGTQVTHEGEWELGIALPNCAISGDGEDVD